jgi:hypothetical protein
MANDVDIYKLADFTLYVTIDRKQYRMQVKQSYLSNQIEEFTVSAGQRAIRLQSNRPLLRGKGLRHRGINWKVVHNTSTVIKNGYGFEQILRNLERHIKKIENNAL